MSQKTSKRFNPNGLMQKLVPFILLLLIAGLLVTIGIIVVSAIGLTPGY